MGVSFGQKHSSPVEEKDVPVLDKARRASRKDYGSIGGEDSLDCPTCQGTGRIPRGESSGLSDRPGPSAVYVCMHKEAPSLVWMCHGCVCVVVEDQPKHIVLRPLLVSTCRPGEKAGGSHSMQWPEAEAATDVRVLWYQLPHICAESSMQETCPFNNTPADSHCYHVT